MSAQSALPSSVSSLLLSQTSVLGLAKTVLKFSPPAPGGFDGFLHPAMCAFVPLLIRNVQTSPSRSALFTDTVTGRSPLGPARLDREG